jgi:hypothetical protein
MKRGAPCGSNFPTRTTEGKVSIIETEPLRRFNRGSFRQALRGAGTNYHIFMAEPSSS